MEDMALPIRTSAHNTSAQEGAVSEAAEALRIVASALLQQAIALLHQIADRPDGERIMTHESKLIPGGTIGKHLRHSIDHYRLLFESVPAPSPTAPLEVNYDARMRLLDMENSPIVAIQTFQEMDNKLTKVVECTTLDKPLQLTALTPYHQELSSTFGRELWFVALHAIHHYSLLRVIATGELGLTLPENFGVAPSTLAFRQFSNATAKEEASEKMEQGPERMASKVKL